MRWVNLPLLKQSWRLTLQHLAVLGPAFVLFGFLNDALLSIGGTGHAQQMQVWEQLARSGGGLEGLAAIDATMNHSQGSSGNGLLSVGLMLLAASLELVIALGLLEARMGGRPLAAASQLAFLRQGTLGSLKGFWRGFLRFLLFCIALSLALIAALVMGSQAGPGMLAILGLMTLGIFFWMMVFLQPYIYATLDCILHPSLSFHDAFLRCEAAMRNRRMEMVLTLCLCGLPVLAGNLPLTLLPAESGAFATIVLTSLLSVPSFVLLLLYYRELAQKFPA